MPELLPTGKDKEEEESQSSEPIATSLRHFSGRAIVKEKEDGEYSFF